MPRHGGRSLGIAEIANRVEPRTKNFSNEPTLRVSCAFAASLATPLYGAGKTRILVKLSTETRASVLRNLFPPPPRASSDLAVLFSPALRNALTLSRLATHASTSTLFRNRPRVIPRTRPTFRHRPDLAIRETSHDKVAKVISIVCCRPSCWSHPTLGSEPPHRV